MCSCRLLLAEKDMEYGTAFARAISSLHKEFDITIQSLERTTAFQEYELILAGGYSEAYLVDFQNEHHIGMKLIMLSESETDGLINQSKKEYRSFWFINKYQNAHSILSDLNFIHGEITGKVNYIRKKTSIEIIGILGDEGPYGKTTFTLAMAKELTRFHDKTVMYLNLEDFPASDLYFNLNLKGRSLSDYLYYLFEKKDEAIYSRLDSFTSRDEDGVETMLQNTGRNDLCLLNHDELLYFVQTIAESNRYDVILIAFNHAVNNDQLKLLNQCRRKLIIQSNDIISERKTEGLIAYIHHRILPVKDKEWVILERNTGTRAADSIVSVPDCNLNLKKHFFQTEEGSVRFYGDRILIDINHEFGAEMKRFAEDILIQRD